jgi:hypothetical protein
MATPITWPTLDGASLLTIADEEQVDAFDLRLRLRLHVPRLGTRATRAQLLAEARRLAAESRAIVPPGALDAPDDAPADVNDAQFCMVDDAEARYVNERLHYLRSHRENSRSYGLRTPFSSSLIALVTVAPADEIRIAALLPSGLSLEDTANFARVFSHRWAPRNAISYLFARTERELRHTFRTPQFVITYVNMNLGFTGVSYRAANWSVIGTEPAHYSYVDEDYQSDRQLIHRFGTPVASSLHARLGSRFLRVDAGLLPLSVFGKTVER